MPVRRPDPPAVHSSALVLDIDRPSHESGGQVTNLQSKVHTVLDRLAIVGYGPAWLGINPLNGKAQVIWLIDPVYAGEGRSSPNTRLLTIATTELNQLLGGDLAFSHRFSMIFLPQVERPHRIPLALPAQPDRSSD